MNLKINVLGTEYTVEVHKVSEDEYMREQHFAGYCCEESKKIVIADVSEKQYFVDMDEQEQMIYQKRTLRHEIIHAFLNESGLSDSSAVPSCGWAKYEEMVDWIALQFPKMVKAFIEADCLGVPTTEPGEAVIPIEKSAEFIIGKLDGILKQKEADSL